MHGCHDVRSQRTIDEGGHAGFRAGQMAVKSIIIVIDAHNVAYSAVLGTISLSALSPGSESILRTTGIAY